MTFWQFFRNWRIGWIGHALSVQPSISAHRKWPEMVVSASTNQVWTKIIIRSYAWSFAIQIQIQAVWYCTVLGVSKTMYLSWSLTVIEFLLFGLKLSVYPKVFPQISQTVGWHPSCNSFICLSKISWVKNIQVQVAGDQLEATGKRIISGGIIEAETDNEEILKLSFHLPFQVERSSIFQMPDLFGC